LSESTDIARSIRRKALELGFSHCGFATADPLTDLEPCFLQWLDAGKAGEMHYLTRHVKIRTNPALLVDNASTIISLAAGYYYPIPPHTPGQPRISRYALGEDYHLTLKSRGRALLNWIQKEIAPVNGRIFTDSAPIFEREWARRAGIGWIGKNGCLIIPHQGSWFFLAEIIVDRNFETDAVEPLNRCGNCSRCIDACPTHALAGDGSMDPRKCISYLTIEHKSQLPEDYRGKWSDWIYGCDICQEVCPWNHKPAPSTIPEFQPRQTLTKLNRKQLKMPNLQGDENIFKGTAVMRAGWSGILRNFEFLENNPPV